MDSFLDFLGNYYFIFIILTVFNLFALVGYFVNIKKSKEPEFKIANENTENKEVSVDMNKSLQDIVNEHATIKNNNSGNYV